VQVEITPDWSLGASAYFYREKEKESEDETASAGTQVSAKNLLPNRFSHFILSNQLQWKAFEWVSEVATGRIRDISKFSSFFKSEPFVNAIKDKQTVALYNTFGYRFLKNVKGYYRFDTIAFDKNYLGDLFLTHTLGVEYRFLNYASLDMRVERNEEGREVEPVMARNNDSIMAILHVWF